MPKLPRTRSASPAASAAAGAGAADSHAAQLQQAAQRAPTIQRLLLAWYLRGHRDLPWRRTADPYAIWVSEVMLQQTRVATAIPYFERFLQQFPTTAALAEAPEAHVLGAWSGLGYYRRARMLHAGARFVVAELGGELPKVAAELLQVPGIGPYTAGAVASIAHDESTALVDGNVQRVLARIFGIREDLAAPRGLKHAWALARLLVPKKQAGNYNQALMELGATLCVPKAQPRCAECPLRAHCAAYASDLTAEIPAPKLRAKSKLERLAALVVTTPEGVLLELQPATGRYAGLWEVPQVAGDDAAPLLARFKIRSAAAHCGSLVHVLTHRRLELEVYHVHLASKSARAQLVKRGDGGLVVAAPDEFEARGTSTLTRRVVEHAAAAVRGPARGSVVT